MNSRIGDVYFDTCTLWNFAAVGRLDLLEERYGHRARWTETVQWEVRRSTPSTPYLKAVLDAAWLGAPVEVGGSPAALTEIDNIRRGLGALPGSPTKHLGEAEIIYHLQFVDQGGFFLTDDQTALDFAQRRGVSGFDTPHIMQECFAYHEVGCPEAFDLIKRMAAADRGVRVPDNHLQVCPS